jgi:NAD(P)-dependent dehydrogenase (short-subunit alcohol dehydrogenase family)
MNILLTGNTSGIGQMVSDRLSVKGHTIYGLSRSSQFKCDVSNYEEVEEWARYFLDCDIHFDAIITCAGTQGELGKVSKTNADKWSETIRINLDGTYNVIRAFMPLMDRAIRPKIVCLAGGGAGNGRAYFSAYAVAKTAVVRLVETISLEEANIDINAVAPGAIKTNIINGPISAGPEVIGEQEYKKAVQQSMGGDDPEPALSLIEWLVSSESDGISGKFISAKWDDWKNFKNLSPEIYTLRRMVP